MKIFYIFGIKAEGLSVYAMGQLLTASGLHNNDDDGRKMMMIMMSRQSIINIDDDDKNHYHVNDEEHDDHDDDKYNPSKYNNEITIHYRR